MKRKMTKVMATAAMAMAVMVGSVPASAANTETGKTDFSLYVANDPTYMVTVPETVAISATENTMVPVTASEVKNLPEGKKISVTLERGSGTMGRLYLEGFNEDTNKDALMTLKIKGTDGVFKSGALEKQIRGMELASFTEDGTMDYEIYPVAFDYPNSTNANLTIQKGVHYSGYVTYGIQLANL